MTSQDNGTAIADDTDCQIERSPARLIGINTRRNELRSKHSKLLYYAVNMTITERDKINPEGVIKSAVDALTAKS